LRATLHGRFDCAGLTGAWQKALRAGLKRGIRRAGARLPANPARGPLEDEVADSAGMRGPPRVRGDATEGVAGTSLRPPLSMTFRDCIGARGRDQPPWGQLRRVALAAQPFVV